jgi:hypothetical protein
MGMGEILDFCEKYEFQARELNTNDRNFDPTKVGDSLLERIKALADSGKVRFSLHPSQGINISDREPGVRH